MAVNIQEAKDTIDKIMDKASKLDKIITRVLNEKVFTEGDLEISLSADQKTALRAKYAELKGELKTEVDNLP